MTCLNFAGTGSRISLPAVSSYRRVKPSRKIALNSNEEVNCRELARRPCASPLDPWTPHASARLNTYTQTLGTNVASSLWLHWFQLLREQFNISPNDTKFFTHVGLLTCLLTDTYPDFTNKVQNGRNEWQLIPLPSPLKHTENLLGYFRRWNPSLKTKATHTLHSAAILFLRDRGERNSV